MRTINFQRPDGTTIKSDHYETSAPADHHKRYGGDSAPDDLPPKADLRSQMTPVEDQQQTSSCVANATAGAYEYLVKAHKGEDYDVSRLFIYFNAREKEGDADQDAGSCIVDAVGGLKKYGACSEETWPFDEDLVTEKPHDAAYEEASQFVIEDAQVVPTDLASWKQALAEGYPIIFGIRLFKSFDRQKRPGLVPSPTPSEASRESHGGHAMLCVGYSDPDEVFIVRNSWGSDWGDDGYCYIPYDYLMNSDYNDGDSWIIRRMDNIPDGTAHWSDDEESLLEEIDGEIANMGDDDYNALLEACGDVHFETRVAALFIAAAGADGECSDEEMGQIFAYVQKVLDAMGVSGGAEEIVAQAADVVDDELVQSTVKIFGEHLSSEALAQMANHLEDVIDADDVSEEERAFVDGVVEAWQLTSESPDEDEDDEDEDDEDDEDEDEDEDN